MSWLLKLAVSNPWVLLAIVLAIFSFGAMTGGSAAWKIQGLRVTAAQQETKSVQQEFKQYRQDQKDLAQAAKDKSDQQREKASKEYEHLSEILDEQINRGAIYRRCVAAGKCGVRNNPVPTDPANTVPTATGTDEAGAHAVPAATGATEDEGQGDPIVTDCARLTLQLNKLQDDIEAQDGYVK